MSAAHSFPACGCWLFLYSPLVAEMAGKAGYDYVVIDMEHAPGTLTTVLPMVQASQLGGAKALVRVPEPDPRWIGRLMDLGADGVVVPMVNSAAQAERLAAGARYSPAGTRGMAAPFVRASQFGAAAEEYLAHYRERFLLAVQIETREAADAAGAIAAVDGIDAVLLGPFDLSASLGFTGEPDHPQVRACIDEVITTVRAAGKRLIAIPTPGLDVESLYRQGVDLVVGGTDLVHLRQLMQADAARHRAAANPR